MKREVDVITKRGVRGHDQWGQRYYLEHMYEIT